MANPTTPRMKREYGDLVRLKKLEKKQGPHWLHLCWVPDGGPNGTLIEVRANNLRNRGYVGKALRRNAQGPGGP